MDWDNVNNLVNGFVEANWTLTAVSYANVAFSKLGLDKWIRVTVIPGPTRLASIGGADNVYRSVGLVSVEVFVKMGSGTSTAYSLSDAICNMFVGLSLAPIIFGEVSVISVGESDGWFQVNVECELHFDTVK